MASSSSSSAAAPAPGPSEAALTGSMAIAVALAPSPLPWVLALAADSAITGRASSVSSASFESPRLDALLKLAAVLAEVYLGCI